MWAVNMGKGNNIRIPDASWKLKDVLIITLSVIVVSLLFYLFTLILFGDNKWNFILSRYVASLLMLILPITWIKIKYGLSRETLGLTANNVNVLNYTIVGMAAAILYILLYYYVLLKQGPAIARDYSYIDLLMLPISLSGFAHTVLAPVGEEIMVRGFIYGYLRTRLGVALGLTLQALLFAMLHYNMFRGNLSAVSQTFIIGLLLGTLYEKSGSLYPSMIAHGVINYLIIIATVFKK